MRVCVYARARARFETCVRVALLEVYEVRAPDDGARHAMKRVRYSRLAPSAREDAELALCREAALMLTLPAHSHVIALRFCLLPKDEFLLFCDLVEKARGLDKAMKDGEWRPPYTRHFCSYSSL